MDKKLQKNINENPYFKYFFDEVFDSNCFKNVSASDMVAIISSAEYVFRRTAKGDFTDLFYTNLYKAEKTLIDRLTEEKAAYIICSKKPDVPFLSPYGVLQDHVLSICVNEKSAETLCCNLFSSEGFYCFSKNEEDLKNYIFKMRGVLGILAVDIYNENSESVHILLSDLYVYYPSENESRDREELSRSLVIFDEIQLCSKKAEYCFRGQYQKNTVEKISSLLDSTSLYVPVDKKTKLVFPYIETDLRGKSIPVFTDYYLAKEMFPEEDFLITPVLVRWLQKLSGITSFIINPNFQDFTFAAQNTSL